MNEDDILSLITSEHSWEQIIYKIVSMENLNPWDLDIKVLSQGFLQYIMKMKELDFNIPAKYLIIAAVLLRMKSDDLRLLNMLNETQEIIMDNGADEIITPTEENQKLDAFSLEIPPKRLTKKTIMVEELVSALRKALMVEERREERKIRLRKDIKIGEDLLLRKIDELYKKIINILSRIKKDEVAFSRLVKNWEREEIIDTFLPLIYLDNSKKVNCRQEEIFKEIYIKKV